MADKSEVMDKPRSADPNKGGGEKVIRVPPALTVRDMAEIMGASPIDVIKQLMNNGIMANINQMIDFDTAAIVGAEMGFDVLPEEEEMPEEEPEHEVPLRERLIAGEDPARLKLRPPIVTVLGHVDHGKTTLLDAIRATNVVAKEVGGITQHIGAYQVQLDDRKITFLDTPGHEAFTAMRARGAEVTDLAVLVVAADDGVMPQTIEAVNHARAARVPIVVALNKVDKQNANPDRVKQGLADIGLVVEDWGGEVICVPISAKQKNGIDDLLENILLVTEVLELKANPDRTAQGTVIEGELDKHRGVLATLLVQNGTLHQGDVIVVGECYGRVRAMTNDKGQSVSEASPAVPVSVMGLSSVPHAGDFFEVVKNERVAREIVTRRIEEKVHHEKKVAVSLDEFFKQVKEGQSRNLNIILKADVQGSIEPIVNSLEDLGDEDLSVKTLHTGTGNISESDVMLAVASNAIVVGFSVTTDEAARRLAEKEGVDIRIYDIIYRLVEDVEKALKGLLEPTYRDVVIGRAKVLQVFTIPRRGKVAGVTITEGKVTRNALARLVRNGKPIWEGKISSLRRFQDDVKEVALGFECGIGLEGCADLQEGDLLEVYVKERES